MIEVNILVNGNKCKQYTHEGKFYIEGKLGSEYEIEIKNNTGGRVEAVTSVDGLSVLTGKAAEILEAGYVLSPYSSYRIKGFRYSSEEVGAFRFGKKECSYASDKKDNSEINCGVISCLVYDEYVVKQPEVHKHYHFPWQRYNEWPYWRNNPYHPWGEIDYIYCSNTTTPTTTPCAGGTVTCCSQPITDINDVNMRGCYGENNDCYMTKGVSMEDSEPFNMGTEWGSKKESKVSTTTFERKNILKEISIYYTNRAGLIKLGVPLDSMVKINYPSGFPGRFAEPPKNWKG